MISQTQMNLTVQVLGTAYPGIGLYTLTITTTGLTVGPPPLSPQSTEQVVLTNVLSIAPGAAILTSVTPTSGAQNSTASISVTGQNTNFLTGTTTAAFSTGGCLPANTAGINVTNVTASDSTHAVLSIAVGATAPTGYQTLCMYTLGETASYSNAFQVTPGNPTLNEVSPVTGQQGQTLNNVQILGQSTQWVQGTTTMTFGQGITVQNLVVNSSTSATATLVIDPTAYLGPRTTTVTTNSEIVSGSFFRVTPSAAIISGITPSSANQGQRILMTINGDFTNWSQELTQFSISGGGYDITVNGVVIDSPTQAVADLSILSISGNAGLGTRTIQMSTVGENVSLLSGFLITGGVPSIVSVSPNYGTVGDTGDNVRITGQFTTWDSTSVVDFGDPAITVTAASTVNSNTSLTAVINIGASATLGVHTVTVRTGVAPNFSVQLGQYTVYSPAAPPTPYISYEYPSVALVGQTLAVNLTGAYTNWLPNQPGGTTIAFGSNIILNDFQVTSLTSAVANITIPANAPLGPATVTVTTGTQQLSTTFSVTVGTPAITLVSSNTVIQGETRLLDLVGQYTTWDSTTQFSFCSGITSVSNVQIFGSTAARVQVTVDPLAATGSCAVVATTATDNEVDNLGGGASFSITPSAAIITSVTPNTALQGATGIVVNVVGFDTLWTNSTAFSFGGGVTVTNTNVVDNLHAALTLSIGLYASPGNLSLTATTGGEVATLANAFVVQPGTPILLSTTNGSNQQQAEFSLGILGQYTNWTAANTTVTFPSGGVTGIVVSVTSGQSITVTGSVLATAYPGCGPIVVTTTGQVPPVLTLYNAFCITPGPAAITQLVPNSLGQGMSTMVQITGTNTNWAPGTTTGTFGPGISLNSLTVNGSTSATASITVASNATVEANTVTLTTLGETASDPSAFTILAATPILLEVYPNTGAQGQAFAVAITGAFTSFTSSSVVSFGAGITVNSVLATNGQNLTANITISPTAFTGTRTVSVDGVALANGFTVTSAAASGASYGYVASGTGVGSIWAYDVAATSGVLSPLLDPEYPAGAGAGSIAAAPSGQFVYVANYNGNDVTADSVNAATGALTPVAGSPFAAGIGPQSVTLAPSGNFAYVVNGPAASISGYTVNTTTGVLAPIPGFTPISGSSIALSASAPFAWVVNRSANSMSAYAVNPATGVLTPIAESQVATDTSPWSVALSPSGQFAYVVDNGANDISGYSINSSTGLLTPLSGSPYSAGTNPQFLTFTPSGQFAYVANAGSGNVSGFSVNATTGALTPIAGEPFAAGNDTYAITVDPTGQFVYAANSTDGSVSAYAINPVSGGLTPLPGSPYASGGLAQSIAIDLPGTAVTSVTPSSGTPNSVSVPVVITGNGTHFDATTTLDFGSGITPAALTPLSPTYITATLNLSSAASLGSRNVTVSTGGEILTLTNGFTVSAGAPSLSSSGPVTFPGTIVGQASAGSSITISNTGAGPASFSGTSLSGTNSGDFTIAGNTCGATLAVGANCSVTVTFSPSASGNRSAALTVSSNDPTSPLNVALSGVGITSTETISVTGTQSFPSTIVGQNSSPVPIYLTNSGNSTVTFAPTPFTLTGTNAADFSNAGTTCGATLAPSAMCSVSLTFSPSGSGSRNATLNVADNAAGSPQQVALSGSGVAVAKTLSLSAGNVTFPTAINVGSTSGSMAVTVTSTGNTTVTFGASSFTGAEPGDFAVTSTCTGTLAPNSSCSLNFTFTPSAVGARTATYNLADDATGNPQAITLNGTGQAAAKTISQNYTAFTFNTQNVGSTSAAQTVTLSNTGNTTVTFSGGGFTLIGADPGDFTITASTCGATLVVGGNCAVSVAFAPTAAGSRTATLNIADDAGNSPQQVTLSGTGQAVAMTLSLNTNNLNFGSQNAGTTSAAQSVTATNTGNVTVTIASVTLGGSNPAEFTIGTDTCGTLAVNASCTVSLTFTPAANGARSAILQFSDNATGSPQTVLLTGTGQSATQNLIFNPENLVYGVLTVGAQASSSVQLENVGTASVSIASVQLTGPNASDFTVTANTCTSLAENATCSVTIAFGPTAPGPRAANLQVNDNAPGNPHNVPILGTGEAVTQTVSQSVTNITFGVTNLGATVGNSFTLYNLGTGSALLAAPVLAGANPGDFSITNNCPVGPTLFNPGGSCSVSVSFTPTAAGPRVATVTVTDNTPESPHVVMLTGTGQSITQVSSQSVTNITYGVTNLGATSSSSFALYNLGTGPIAIAAPTPGGANPGDFSIAGDSCPVSPATLGSGGSCTISVSFTPTAAGVRTASVTVTDNTPQSPHVVQLTGTGQSITQISSQSVTNITYGVTNIGTTVGNSFTLYSLGTGSITIATPALGGPNPGDFSISSDSCSSTLGSGGSCTIGISFTPTAVGVRTATVTVTDNTPQSPHVVMLTGTGQSVTQISSQSVTNITYGVTNIGATVGNSFTLYSLGTGSITIATPTLGGSNPGDFSITSDSCPVSPTTLGSGGSCTIGVSFTPTAAGVRTASVTVTDNTPQSPHVVQLTGTGQTVTQSVSFSVGTVVFGATTLGASVNSSFSMYNLGTGPVTVSSYALGGTNPGDFSIYQNNCPTAPTTLGSGGSCSVFVSFTPTTARRP